MWAHLPPVIGDLLLCAVLSSATISTQEHEDISPKRLYKVSDLENFERITEVLKARPGGRAVLLARQN